MILSTPLIKRTRNLLQNAGYDTYTGTLDDEISDTFTGWTVAGSTCAKTGRTNAAAALKGAWSSAIEQANIPARAATGYKLTIYHRGQTGYYAVRTSLAVDIAVGSIAAAGSWTKKEVTFTTPDPLVSIKITFYSTHADEILLDDLELIAT